MEGPQTPTGSGKLLVLAGQPSRLESARGFVRNLGLWFHYLYSEIWGYSSRRDGGASSFANATHVPSPDVLVWSRDLRWGNCRRWRWHVYASSLTSIIALLICITGCQDKRASLE